MRITGFKLGLIFQAAEEIEGKPHEVVTERAQVPNVYSAMIDGHGSFCA